MEKENKKRVLLIVDVQNDFVTPTGSLYVKNSSRVPIKIASIVRKFDGVVFTMDSHPWNHTSFKDEGGQWPRHCVMNTSGGAIPDTLIHSVCEKPTLFLRKGEDKNEEEYGAFDNTWNKRTFEDYLIRIFPGINDNVDVYVCGVAGDYCVANTVKGLKLAIDNKWFTQWNYKNDFVQKINEVYLIKDLCPCIDENFDIETFAKEHGVITITSNKL